jgi:hypothetical protein
MTVERAVSGSLVGSGQEHPDTIKHAVREEAGHRCVRCLHPYIKGAGRWSDCDEQCTHGAPTRWRMDAEDEWSPVGTPALHDSIRHAISMGREVQAEYRILTVHHLDGVKGNCRWWNLAALCQRCHLQIQGKVRMERVYPWAHSEWFRPYVAGYYAWTYLGEDLDRAETLARLDELLALELVPGA